MRRRRQSPVPIIAAIVLAVALAISVFANWSLATTGEFALPGSSRTILAAPKPEAPEPRTDLVSIFVPARDLPAFHEVVPGDFYRTDGTPSVLRVAKSSIEGSDALLSPTDSIGRVLRRGKPRNRAFDPTDFFPVGTQPGLTAGVPAGMVGRWVDCERVHGLEGLAMGDSVSLVASSTLEPLLPDGLTDEERVLIQMQHRMAGHDRQPDVRRVVTHGIVVQPPVPHLDQNGKSIGRRAFVALDPVEAIELTAALEIGDAVHAIIQSGQADAGDVDLLDIRPTDPMTPIVDRPRPAEVEQIDGANRSTHKVPRGAASSR